jgi:Asp-tRNA(Asn)/Glu-tRNA(Gln) amidotransferase A subunit family amidase
MNQYNLESLRLPVLQGAMLKLFAAAVGNPLVRPLLLGSLLKSGGVTRIRTLKVNETPLPSPLVPSPEPGGPLSAQKLGLYADGSDNHTGGLPFSTIGDYDRAYRGGTTPLQVAERIIAAIEADDRLPLPLKPFIAIDRDDLLRQAEESTRRRASGREISALDGVPVAVKDELDMIPYPTTVGTRFLGRSPATADATTVARLRASGALLLGKANMHEIGINPTGHNPHYGHARNPYDPNHDAGGSSSGCAVAVAAGLAPIALGADGGGSIRVPAAHCGLVGLKATYGRISGHGAAPIDPSVGHIGPIAGSVRDLVYAYAVLAGPDPCDRATIAQPNVSITGWDREDLTGVTFGVYPPWFEHSTPEIVETCRDLLGKLESAGAMIREVEIPGLDEIRVAHAITILSEIASAMSSYRDRFHLFAPATRLSLSLATAFTASDYLQAQRVRAQGMATFDGLFRDVDAILTPATAVTAPRIPDNGLPAGISDLGTVTEIMRYIVPGNLLGLPAISFPAGYDRDGLPIGMQAMGRHWEEHVLLRIARVAEGMVEHRRPGRISSILGAS